MYCNEGSNAEFGSKGLKTELYRELEGYEGSLIF